MAAARSPDNVLDDVDDIERDDEELDASLIASGEKGG